VATAALDAIADEVRGCVRCRLSTSRTQAVPGEGDPSARLFLVGEAPGATEDRVGRPFRGASGTYLTSALEEAGMARDEIFVTSVCKCRPPRNRDPRPDEMRACADYLDRQLELVAPQVVLAMGLTAAVRLGAAGRGERLADVRERAQPPGDGGWRLLVTYHPAAAMRFPRLREPFAADLGRAVIEARGGCR
jgi:uracil-DNA glycosylase